MTKMEMEKLTTKLPRMTLYRISLAIIGSISRFSGIPATVCRLFKLYSLINNNYSADALSLLRTKIQHDLEDLNDVAATRLDLTAQDKKELALTRDYLKKLLELNQERQTGGVVKRGWFS